MRLRNVWVGALGLALATSAVACGGGSNETPSRPPAAAPAVGR